MSALTLPDRASTVQRVRERSTVPGSDDDSPFEGGDPFAPEGYADFSWRRRPTVAASDDEESGTDATRVGDATGESADRSAAAGPDGPAGAEATGPDRPGFDDVFGPGPSEFPRFDADVDRIIERVYEEVERKMRIERERRGL